MTISLTLRGWRGICQRCLSHGCRGTMRTVLWWQMAVFTLALIMSALLPKVCLMPTAR